MNRRLTDFLTVCGQTIRVYAALIVVWVRYLSSVVRFLSNLNFKYNALFFFARLPPLSASFCSRFGFRLQILFLSLLLLFVF